MRLKESQITYLYCPSDFFHSGDRHGAWKQRIRRKTCRNKVWVRSGDLTGSAGRGYEAGVSGKNLRVC